MLTSALHAQDVEWARDLYVHGLKGRAMEIYIGILHTLQLPPMPRLKRSITWARCLSKTAHLPPP